MVFDSDLAEEAGTDSEQVQAMRKGAVFFYVFLVAFRFLFRLCEWMRLENRSCLLGLVHPKSSVVRSICSILSPV